MKQMAMDRLSAMKTFTQVVDAGSFAAAARQLNLDQALVTRQIAALEKHLQVKLMERTTRSMRLTDAGEAYLARCRAILSDVEDAEASVAHAQRAVAGRVRLALPTLFGKERVALQLAQMREAYPQLAVDVALLDRPVDPVAEGFDVVIADASHGVSATAVARPLVSVPFALCASPTYLARHGMPEHPQDLARHRVVLLWPLVESGATSERWELTDATGRTESVLLADSVRLNNYALSLEAVACGIGIGRFTPRMMDAESQSGRLVPVLPAWRAGWLSFNVVYPSRRLVPERVRLVIDVLLMKGEQMQQENHQAMSRVAGQGSG
jgi:DNA-binding transcriptional LysR family regulator